ncbi:MAG: hypothetical protein LBG20_00625 [Holosporaceae bacterium]|jgi:hypothetical protein|nr:hypothetical protein [Holosporaceae bacterium]
MKRFIRNTLVLGILIVGAVCIAWKMGYGPHITHHTQRAISMAVQAKQDIIEHVAETKSRLDQHGDILSHKEEEEQSTGNTEK